MTHLLGKKTTWNLAIMQCVEVCLARSNTLLGEAQLLKETSKGFISCGDAAEARALELTQIANKFQEMLQDMRLDAPLTPAVAAKLEGQSDDVED